MSHSLLAKGAFRRYPRQFALANQVRAADLMAALGEIRPIHFSVHVNLIRRDPIVERMPISLSQLTDLVLATAKALLRIRQAQREARLQAADAEVARKQTLARIHTLDLPGLRFDQSTVLID